MGILLRNRNLHLLLVADAVSVFGNVVFTVAVMAGVYEASGSILGTSLVMILSTGTRFLAGLAGLNILDRVPHRTVMVAADLVRAVAVGGLAVALYQRLPSALALTYGVAAVVGLAEGLFAPARAALLPEVVRPGELLRANGIASGFVQAVQTASWALAAGLVALLGDARAVAFDACGPTGSPWRWRRPLRNGWLWSSHWRWSEA